MQIIEPKRCAVYTRKSHEDGLEQEFNSLDAQRDASVNYIASQKSNGWQLINESYDDGGFSGGNTNRPALQRLLQDVRSGKVDIVVVYKIDRLSRSLTDFATLQTEFEKYGVAFCSVTQDINTATSAGRMMLNILMTFAQYEREIIAERIKDKLSASKRKGKYVGGLLPLGYDADSEAMKIIINPAEVKAVKLIFTEYVRTGSLKQVQRLLEERNIRTKAWISKKGIAHGGNPINLAVLRNMITNPIYIGKLRYQGKVYDAEHEGIISPELWQKAQETLKANKRSAPQRMSNSIKPFAGLVYCGNCNAPMFLSKAVKKNGREYVYYVCQKDDRRANATCPVHRVPAEHLEKVLLAQVGRLFRTPAVLARICNEDFAGVLQTLCLRLRGI
jgi:site-specific DNA recombinase